MKRNIIGYIRKNGDCLFIFLLYFIIHLFMGFECWDDVYYKTYLKTDGWSLIELIVNQYRYETSRIFIEAAIVMFAWLPPIAWKIVDSLMIVLLYHSLSAIIKLLMAEHESDNKYKWCRMLLFLSFPYALMATAGWLTTTINWTWMLTLLVYSIKELLYAVNGKRQKGKLFKNMLFCVAFLYATNFDVAAMIMFILLVIIGISCRKATAFKICAEYWEGLVITVFNLILFVLCPGNRVRMQRDAVLHHTADVLELSFLGKIRMGINSTFYHYMSIPNVVLFTVCVILAVAVLIKIKKEQVLVRVAALIPAGLVLIWTGYIFLTYTLRNHVLTYIYPDAAFNMCPKWEQYLALVSALALVGIIIYLLRYLISENSLFVFLTVAFLIWGLLPDIILGFTTTVSTSILRVVSFLYLFLILLSCIVVEKNGMLKKRVTCLGIFCLGISGTIMNFAQMIRHIIIYG